MDLATTPLLQCVKPWHKIGSKFVVSSRLLFVVNKVLWRCSGAGIGVPLSACSGSLGAVAPLLFSLSSYPQFFLAYRNFLGGTASC